MARAVLERRRREECATRREDATVRSAEASLAEFVRQAWPINEPHTEYLHNWHIDLICEYLEAVTAGRLTRVIFNMPPRYMKSYLVSVMWPCWEWLRLPSQRWLFWSYAKQLATDLSLKRRYVVESRWYQSRWGDRVRLADDQNQKTEFTNTKRGLMFASSMDSAGLGYGGNRLVVDDPHDTKGAESEIERQSDIDYFNSTIYGRLDDKINGAIVVVMQRLNEGDLTGHLKEQTGWTLVKVPAREDAHRVVTFPMSGKMILREPGEPLWPAREGRGQLDDAEARDAYVFAGQMQQEPVPRRGGLFQREWLPAYDIVPQEYQRLMRYWDKAASEGSGAYSAGVLMGLGYDNLIYVLDVIRGQWNPARREEIIRQAAEADTADVEIGIEREGGSGGPESATNTLINLRGFVARAYNVAGKGDKVARARPLASWAGAGGEGREGLVRLRKADWNTAFVNEMCMFPRGKYKDQVDAAAGAFNALALEPVAGAFVGGGTRKTLGDRVES